MDRAPLSLKISKLSSTGSSSTCSPVSPDALATSQPAVATALPSRAKSVTAGPLSATPEASVMAEAHNVSWSSLLPSGEADVKTAVAGDSAVRPARAAKRVASSTAGPSSPVAGPSAATAADPLNKPASPTGGPSSSAAGSSSPPVPGPSSSADGPPAPSAA